MKKRMDGRLEGYNSQSSAFIQLLAFVPSSALLTILPLFVCSDYYSCLSLFFLSLSIHYTYGAPSVLFPAPRFRFLALNMARPYLQTKTKTGKEEDQRRREKEEKEREKKVKPGKDAQKAVHFPFRQFNVRTSRLLTKRPLSQTLDHSEKIISQFEQLFFEITKSCWLCFVFKSFHLLQCVPSLLCTYAYTHIYTQPTAHSA